MGLLRRCLWIQTPTQKVFGSLGVSIYFSGYLIFSSIDLFHFAHRYVFQDFPLDMLCCSSLKEMDFTHSAKGMRRCFVERERRSTAFDAYIYLQYIYVFIDISNSYLHK